MSCDLTEKFSLYGKEKIIQNTCIPRFVKTGFIDAFTSVKASNPFLLTRGPWRVTWPQLISLVLHSLVSIICFILTHLTLYLTVKCVQVLQPN